ncbi:pilus (MSHA type) biogenesis protein MshL [Chitinimonas sp. BJB300]|uniref:pilus (MSHA type) biogenesis protein MshL n=1 Tax=Chitinimonas sp. BJB300 TaxID=1559339 RepID=UPI0013042C11|nr:pilus (MSHA type) biogenesis protein MshL [Chitinimonas sp. BJB300]
MRRLVLIAPLLLFAGCATHPLSVTPGRHAQAPALRPQDLPATVDRPNFLPPPSANAKADTYSVVVSNVPVRDLLFALGRDAKLNVDVHPLIKGNVTLNALNQTMPQILDRITRQVDIRYTLENSVLVIQPDSPFVKSYSVDYVNVARSAQGKVSISTSVAATGGSVSGGGGSAEGRNSSNTEVSNVAENKFWERMETNIRELILSTRRAAAQEKREREAQEAKENQVRNAEMIEQKAESDRRRQEDRLKAAQAVAQAGAGAPQLLSMVIGNNAQGANADIDQTGIDVFIHPETGVVTVNATAREHTKVQEYLNRVSAGARRQVLIEATIVEVTLGDRYQAGIDWSVLKTQDNRLNYSQDLTANKFATSPLALLTYTKTASSLLNGSNFTATIKLLEQFGKTKVLSSPKIMALNNQTALLKVVDERVYFNVKLEVTEATTTTPERREYTSEIRTVPVGVVMSVTPQIGENAMVSLNVRPTISRITGYKIDPALRLTGSTVDNEVPEIQVRELESTLKLADGQMAILGGLIQDNIQTSRVGWPLLSRLPWGIGDLFSYRDDSAGKTELVIFMRPVVIHDPSLNGDLHEYQQYLPKEDFFNRPADEISVFKSGLTAH